MERLRNYSQNNLEKENNVRRHTVRFKKPKSLSNQHSMLLMKELTHRSVEQNRKSRIDPIFDKGAKTVQL